MTSPQWVTVGSRYCDLIKRPVELQERRIYAPDMVAGPSVYRVLGQRCTAAIDCNLAGVPCCHAFSNPTTDRFALK